MPFEPCIPSVAAHDLARRDQSLNKPDAAIKAARYGNLMVNKHLLRVKNPAGKRWDSGEYAMSRAGLSALADGTALPQPDDIAQLPKAYNC